MRKQLVFSIFKKEILDLLRDKKTMFVMIILPIILYPLLMIGGSQIAMLSMSTMAEKEQKVVLDFQLDEDLKDIINQYDGDYGKLDLVESEDPHRDLENDKISAYVLEEKIEGQINYKVYMKNAKEDSSNAAFALREIFNIYNRDKVEDNIKSLGLNIKTTLEPIVTERIDISKGEEMAGYFLGMVLPMMLIIGLLIGATYPATDMMAGEKERGTLETLLTLPLTNLELIMGKYLAVAAMSIVTALLNVLGIVLSMSYLFLTMGAQEGNAFIDNIDISRMLLPALIAFLGLILFALIISAISMSVCSLASSYKEAQNYISVVMIVGMLPSYVTMIPTFQLNPFTAMIPIANVALLIKGVFTFQYDIASMAIVLVSNIGFVLISIWILTKMYRSENILFGNGKGFSFLERRSQIIGGKMPTLGDGFAVYGITLLLFIYGGTFIQMKLGLVGVGLSQFLFLGLALGMAYYTKAPMKKVFRFKSPAPKYILGGILIWLGAFITANLVSSLLLFIFPQNMEVLEGLGDLLMEDYPFIISLIIIALMPAICEEVLFRGYLLTASSEKNQMKRGIIISSIMFGIMHLYIIKIIPTAILGLAFGYLVYKSGSIFMGIILHFINNSLAVIAMHYPSGILEKFFYLVEVDFNNLNISKFLILLGLAMVALWVGSFIVNMGEKSTIEA